jgi:hypothetical protein
VLTEHRAWQQYLWNGPALVGVVQSRTRVEQRSMEDNDGLSWRARQFTRFTKPGGQTRGLAGRGVERTVHPRQRHARSRAGLRSEPDLRRPGHDRGPGARLEVGYVNQAIRGGSSRSGAASNILLGFLNLTY